MQILYENLTNGEMRTPAANHPAALRADGTGTPNWDNRHLYIGEARTNAPVINTWTNLSFVTLLSEFINQSPTGIFSVPGSGLYLVQVETHLPYSTLVANTGSRVRIVNAGSGTPMTFLPFTPVTTGVHSPISSGISAVGKDCILAQFDASTDFRFQYVINGSPSGAFYIRVDIHKVYGF